MKKILLLIFFVSLSNLIYSQSTENQPIKNGEDVIIMSKEKHEALRRDIEDYKLLLIKYQSLRIEQEVLVGDLQREAKLLESKSETLTQARDRIAYLESEITTLQVMLEKQSQKIAELDKNYKNMDRLYYIEKGKVYRMKKGQSQVYIWKATTVFFIIAMLIVGSHSN